MLKKIILTFLLAISGLAASACVETISQPFNKQPQANRGDESFAEFKDIPYPATMAFNKSESFTYQRRNTLAGVVVVSGRMNTDELGAYYDQHLPGHGWEPAAEAQYNSLVSVWKKGEQMLVIIAKPTALSSLTSDLKVELWVAPPRDRSDLGKRTIYQKPTTKEAAPETKESGGGWKFWSKDKKDQAGGGVVEEDL